MAVRAIQFKLGDRGIVAQRNQLSDRALRAFARDKPEEATAYAVQESELDALIEPVKDLVLDRGRKHQAIQLSRTLLGADRIPAVRCDYRAEGSAKKSIRALLHAAARAGERNVFVMGTSEPIFERLWDQAVAEPEMMPFSRPPEGRVGDGLLQRAVASTSVQATDSVSATEVPPDLCQYFLGSGPEVQRVRQCIMRAANRDNQSVLILGESGTGKELVARAIHAYSNKRRGQEGTRAGNFIPVNCGTIPRELFESELFGCARGAYSGAYVPRAGLWRMANHGTLFLDEIADLLPEHQAKLLRVMEDGVVRPVGTEKEFKVEARIVAATSKDLSVMVQKGMFRGELYYRLRGAFLIQTPPLREHTQDIPLIADRLWKRITQNPDAELPADILEGLGDYRWPGNVRELEGVLVNLRMIFEGADLGVEHLHKVFYLSGQPTRIQQQPSDKSVIESYKLESFRHLRRVDEVVRACKVALRPMSIHNRTDPESAEEIDRGLAQGLNEMDWLCKRPLLFYNESTFRAVHTLKGKLTFFCGALHADAAHALRYYVMEVRNEFDHVLSEIFKERERLVP